MASHEIKGVTEVNPVEVAHGKKFKTESGEEIQLYGATLGCHNGTGVQWKDLHIRIDAVEQGAHVLVYVNTLNANGSSGGQIASGGPQTALVPPGGATTGEVSIDMDLNPALDADANFSIRMSSAEYPGRNLHFRITPTDASGYPIS